MAKNKPNIPSIFTIADTLKKDKFLPVYFLFGTDHFSIDNVLHDLQKAVQPFISSDFDVETITAEKGSKITPVLDSAMAFPFGSGKKLVILKNFERITDKKNLEPYLKNPPLFTILVIVNSDDIPDASKEPFATLAQKNFIFEAKELKGFELAKWVVAEATKNSLVITQDNAMMLVDLVGDEKSLLEMHIQKFRDYLNDSNEVTPEVIEKLSSQMKTYNIFDLQDVIAKGDKSQSLKIMYNLLDTGTDLIYIVSMLNRFISTVAQSIELNKKKIPARQASRELGLSEYYYMKCSNSRLFHDHNRLLNSSRAIYRTDYSLKTTQTDPKILASILISEMLS
ncbi:MAG: DNA polymerase III subunit delta [bacterium]